MSTSNGPQSVFSVGFTRVSEAGISLDQQVHQTLVDHRGLIEMPAYAVMAESVTSGAYWYTFAEPVAIVQSWLARTALRRHTRLGRRPGLGRPAHPGRDQQR